jgi:hypothetical protein
MERPTVRETGLRQHELRTVGFPIGRKETAQVSILKRAKAMLKGLQRFCRWQFCRRYHRSKRGGNERQGSYADDHRTGRLRPLAQPRRDGAAAV